MYSYVYLRHRVSPDRFGRSNLTYPNRKFIPTIVNNNMNKCVAAVQWYALLLGTSFT